MANTQKINRDTSFDWSTPSQMLDESKRWLRRWLIRERQGLPLRSRLKWSRRLIKHVLSSAEFKKSKTIAVFLSFGSEVETSALIKSAWEKGKNVVIPIASDDFNRPHFVLLKHGDLLFTTRHGYQELVTKKEKFNFRNIDLIFVPGLGFDTRGQRIGYGSGVYDRLLKATPNAHHVGLFFEAQRIFSIPFGRHDKPLDEIFTENGARMRL